MPILVTRNPGQRVRSLDYNRVVSALLDEHMNLTTNFHREKIRLGDSTNNDDKGLIAQNLAGGDPAFCWRQSEECWGVLISGIFECVAKVSDIPKDNDFLVCSNVTNLPNAVPVVALTKDLCVQGADSNPVTIKVGRCRDTLANDTVEVRPGLSVGCSLSGIIGHNSVSGLFLQDELAGLGKLKDLRKPGEHSFVPDYPGAVTVPVGTGTPDLIFDAGEGHNLYVWESASGTLELFQVVVQVKLVGFVEWDLGVGITLSFMTDDVTGDSLVSVEMLDTTGSSVTLSGGAGLTSSGTVDTVDIGVGAGTFDDGGYITLIFDLESKSTKKAFLGRFELNYK